MSGKTQAQSKAVLDAQLRNVSLAGGAAIYLALTSTTPSAAAAGTELTGNGYARSAITFGAATNNGSTGGTASNDTLIEFATPTGNGSAAVGWELWTAVSGGTRLRWGTLAASIAWASGVPVVVPVGAVVCTEI